MEEHNILGNTDGSEKDNFVQMQQNRKHYHPNLCKNQSTSVVDHDHDDEDENKMDTEFRFIILADTQFGMMTDDETWENEMKYCQYVVMNDMNQMQPRPKFCCVCGDLVNMTSSIYNKKRKPKWALQKLQEQQQHEQSNRTSTTIGDSKNHEYNDLWSEEECDTIQQRQFRDFKNIWNQLHPDIALVCVCGNHDVGNTPTSHSIRQYTDQFGSDYLSFWCYDSYFIVLNSSLFNTSIKPYDMNNRNSNYEHKNESETANSINQDNNGIIPSDVLYQQQLEWLKGQLIYANSHTKLDNIIVLMHHPLFIYEPYETEHDSFMGSSTFEGTVIKDSYFHIPYEHRILLLKLFAEYDVNVIFSGHYHQNHLSEATIPVSNDKNGQQGGNETTISKRIQMIITSSVSSLVVNSNGGSEEDKVRNSIERKNVNGYRIVKIQNQQKNQLDHHFVPIVLPHETSKPM